MAVRKVIGVYTVNSMLQIRGKVNHIKMQGCGNEGCLNNIIWGRQGNDVILLYQSSLVRILCRLMTQRDISS